MNSSHQGRIQTIIVIGCCHWLPESTGDANKTTTTFVDGETKLKAKITYLLKLEIDRGAVETLKEDKKGGKIRNRPGIFLKGEELSLMMMMRGLIKRGRVESP